MSFPNYAAAELTDSAVTVEATKARQNFRDLVDAAVTRGIRIVVTRNGKPMAALVSMRDLDRLNAGDAALDRRMADEAGPSGGDGVPFDVFHDRAVAAAAHPEMAGPPSGPSGIDSNAVALGEVVGQIAAGIVAAAFQRAVVGGVAASEAVEGGAPQPRQSLMGAELSKDNLIEVLKDPDQISRISRDAADYLTSRAG